VSGINSSTVLWYMSRSTGVVSLVLLTAVVLIGLLITQQGRLPGLPRFAVTGLHRNLSLLAVAFVAIHVLAAVADSYVSIPLTATVIPFASGYERFWLGLGAAAADLMAAMIVTSLLRRHLSRRVWRGVHLLAYVSWPVALAHSIGSSTDLQHGWALYLATGCAVVVTAAVVWRLAAAARAVPRAERVTALMSARRRPGSRPGSGRDLTGAGTR